LKLMPKWEKCTDVFGDHVDKWCFSERATFNFVVTCHLIFCDSGNLTVSTYLWILVTVLSKCSSPIHSAKQNTVTIHNLVFCHYLFISFMIWKGVIH
jgi:hypothetical protein